MKSKTKVVLFSAFFSMAAAYAECHTEMICTPFDGCGPQVICTPTTPDPLPPPPPQCQHVWVCPSAQSPGTDCHWETVCH